MKKEVVKLAKKLIAIPSYVDKEIDERKIGDFMYKFFLKNCPWLKLKKQKVINDRFNIIAADNYPTKLLICGHMDTVVPRSDWNFNPLKPFIRDNNLYGLGAMDMKGSLAALLIALKNLPLVKGLLVFLYIDEEYNFAGMRKFVKNYDIGNQLKLIFSADGGDLKIGYACRGLIDLDFEVIGKAGHAAWPDLGINAVLAAVRTIDGLSKVLNNDFSDPVLGP